MDPFHVVCRECPYEDLVAEGNAPTGDPARDAGFSQANHRHETGHRVVTEQISGPRVEGGR